MKKMKKYIAIAIALIILTITNNVSALTTNYNATLSYAENVMDQVIYYKNRIDNLKSYLTNINCIYGNYCVNNGKFILIINTSTMSSNTWEVTIMQMGTLEANPSNSAKIKLWWRPQYSDGRLTIQGPAVKYNFNFSGDNVTSHNNRTEGIVTAVDQWNSNGWSGNPMSSDIDIKVNNYVVTDLLNSSYNINFEVQSANSTMYYDIPINVNNVINIPTVNINAKEFFDSLMPIAEPEPEKHNCEVEKIGSVSAPNNFTISVNDTIDPEQVPVWHEIYLKLLSPKVINNDYWGVNIQKIGNNASNYEVRTDYQCFLNADDNTTYECRLKYWLFTNENENVTANVNFNFIRNSLYNSYLMDNIDIVADSCGSNEVDMTITNNDDINDSSGNNNGFLGNITSNIGNILNMFAPNNLIYLVVPTQSQMQSLLNEMQEKMESKLGILGLPLVVYTRLMNLANNNTPDNWCISWDNVEVPNFENFNIINGGQWCFNSILENQKINNFRNVCIAIIGGLIILAFLQYLNNTYHLIIESPERDNYEYITTQDIYDVNDSTGELTNHKYIQKTTTRERRDKK